jgi:hypothetical protein
VFHFIDPKTQAHVFTRIDPREDGFGGPVEGDVTLVEVGEIAVREGETDPIPCLGRSRENPRLYRVFGSASERQAAGFQNLGVFFVIRERWSDIRRG